MATPPTIGTSAPRMRAGWLAPTLAYMLLVGSLGVTSKLAFRSLDWQDLMLWQGAGFIVVTAVWLARGDAGFRLLPNTPWAIVSAFLILAANITLFLALTNGEASTVVPISAAYPAVTVVLGALVLSERVSLARAGGLCLVVGGVVLLTGTS